MSKHSKKIKKFPENDFKELYIPVERKLQLMPDYFYLRKMQWNNNYKWLNDNDLYFNG